ncbi:MAG: hypothetical protein O3C40_04850 [Planctomycetota bacterium]|nr:hypothetical protein [Planctomycetota bacterium]
MNFTKIRRTVALISLVLLLAATTWVGLFFKQVGSRDINDWIHAFCLTQSVLLAACAVYGPGRLIVRVPLVIAWGLAIGFALATLNLISMPGTASLAAGALLVATGTLSPLILFALHRWRTGVCLAFGVSSSRPAARRVYQLSLQMLMILTTAFAVMGVVARAAVTAPADPYGTEHDILVVQAWLGFFPCLAAAPALLVVFRPSWKIVLACGFFVVVTLADPLLLALAAPFVFEDKTFFPKTTWDTFLEIGSDSFLWHGQAVIATVVYVLLARAAGFQMVVPNQSNDKKPNPSAQPATEAGCVQD